MQIGIAPVLAGGNGVHQYSMTMLQALDEWRANGCEDEFTVFADAFKSADVFHPNAVALSQRGWAVRSIHPPPSKQKIPKRRVRSWLRRAIGEARSQGALRWMKQFQRVPAPKKEGPRDPHAIRDFADTRRWLNRCGIELMLYTADNLLAFEAKIPYLMAIHDLQHRLQPEFPEVSADGESEAREYRFRNGTKYATLLLADSEVGKEDILNFYGACGVTPDRVKVLPYVPARALMAQVSERDLVQLRTTYRLPDRYIFYPAQFWPHKNHSRIIRALGLLKQEYELRVPAVFCGSYTGAIRTRTFDEMMVLSGQLGLLDQVHYLGHVSDAAISGLYAGAQALIMPTFFGPTNIPLLEAWGVGCPALTSDIRGIREQAGDAAILVDPRSVEAIADGIRRLWTDDTLRGALADRGRRRLATYTPDDYRRRLIEILEEGKARVRSEQPRLLTC